MDHPTPTDLATRATSSFPLSIGTALAFESLFDGRESAYDTSRERPARVDLSKYQTCYINIETLIRNILQSVPSSVFIKTDKKELYDTLLQEIETTFSLFATEGQGIVQPVFYHATYKSIRKHPPHSSCRFRVATNDSQKHIEALTKLVVEKLAKEWNQLLVIDDQLKPGQRDHALILTHIPHDLISYKNFGTLDLLESHTGKLKKRFEWASKYHPVGDRPMDHLPFHRKLLWVFGDKHLIQPMPISMRREILRVADERQWTPFTTLEKVNLDIRLTIKEPYVVMVLNTIQ